MRLLKLLVNQTLQIILSIAKISKYQMSNDQMPNYGVQTQYVSIRSIKELYISWRRRSEIREEKKRDKRTDESRRKEKIRKREENIEEKRRKEKRRK